MMENLAAVSERKPLINSQSESEEDVSISTSVHSSLSGVS
jgi:hypothetical protein